MHANSKYALAQDGQQSTEIKMAKPHAHVMMTQMSTKQGIKAFGECGSDAITKGTTAAQKGEHVGKRAWQW